MWKDRNFLIILFAELAIIFQVTFPYNYFHYHCNHTDSSQKHGDSPNQANSHCHAPGDLIRIKNKSFSSNPKTGINSVLFVILFATISSIYNRVLFAFFPINDRVILKQYHSTRLSFRGPPAVA
jgi:hypothetical protein